MDKEIDFEKMIKRLEEINEKMNDKNISLDTSISLYEEGMKISKELEKALKEAEEKVEKVIEVNEK